MISSPKPPQLAWILLKLQGLSVSHQEQLQLVEQAQQAFEHLEKVAKPLYRPEKGSGPESVRYASYAFGSSNADLAQQALPQATELRDALEGGDFENARAAAKEIENLFSR